MKQLFFTALIVSAIMALGSFLSGWMISRAMHSQEIEKQAKIARQAILSSDLNEEKFAENPKVSIVDSEKNLSGEKSEIVYSDDGFSPVNLTVKEGNSVVFKNESSKGMWVASADHPSHFIYGGDSSESHCPDNKNIFFDQCEAVQEGSSWSFRFDKRGIWEYHNHLNSSRVGIITVE